MGHCIEYVEFPRDTSKEQMLQYAGEFAAANVDRQENPHGLYDNVFKKVSGIAKNRKEAEECLDNQGFYVDGYIEFYSDAEPTKRYRELTEQIARKRDSLAEYVVKHSVKNRKAKYITCPECGSKINTEAWKANEILYFSGGSENCPICEADLRTESTQAEIKRRLDKIDELKERRDSLIRGKGKIKILAKYEVHC